MRSLHFGRDDTTITMFNDPILQKLIQKYPAPTWIDRSDFLFENLIETIVSQQLSIKAADSIFKRFLQLFSSPEGRTEQSEGVRLLDKGKEDQGEGRNIKSFPTPQQILLVEQGSIRQIGVSTAKAKYIHNVAQAFLDKDIEIEKIKQMSDEEVIESLVKIKGVGKWTAEMILIFTLNRPNIFSHGDLGLRNAIRNLYGITEKDEIMKLAESWSPNKSLASWYLWRSLENKT